jgi:hypothetical protein
MEKKEKKERVSETEKGSGKEMHFSLSSEISTKCHYISLAQTSFPFIETNHLI